MKVYWNKIFIYYLNWININLDYIGFQMLIVMPRVTAMKKKKNLKIHSKRNKGIKMHARKYVFNTKWNRNWRKKKKDTR